ncbi:MAG: YraN family protein [Geminicoccaceae bacterium]
MRAKQRVRSYQDAERRGRFAERLAAWSCRIRGFRIVAERYRTPFGEIDLVMRRGSLLVFAEVKARASFEQAAFALRPQQQQRLARAAEIYLRDHPLHAACSTRFDLIAIRPWRWPRRIVDVWRLQHAF